LQRRRSCYLATATLESAHSLATFPLFLIARELRLRTSDAPELRIIDTALLAIVSVLTVGLAIWVDAGQ
jgi:hypothetical protein